MKRARGHGRQSHPAHPSTVVSAAAFPSQRSRPRDAGSGEMLPEQDESTWPFPPAPSRGDRLSRASRLYDGRPETNRTAAPVQDVGLDLRVIYRTSLEIRCQTYRVTLKRGRVVLDPVSRSRSQYVFAYGPKHDATFFFRNKTWQTSGLNKVEFKSLEHVCGPRVNLTFPQGRAFFFVDIKSTRHTSYLGLHICFYFFLSKSAI